MAKSAKSVWGQIGLAAVGAAAGAVVSLLVSPKNGKQNRDALVGATKKVVKKAKKTLKK